MVTHTCTQHQPGEPCYCHCGCRCQGCSSDRARRQKVRRWRGPTRVPADRTREHLDRLHQHLSWTELAALTNSERGTLRAIHQGRTSTVYRTTEAAILAVKPREARSGYVDRTGTWRRLQALMALGWSLAAISRESGHSDKWAGMLLNSERISFRSRDTIRATYDRLWNQRPPQETIGERVSVGQTLAIATKYGFAPPLAWDDDEIDDPAATPHDWQRGDRTLASGAELVEAVELGASIGDLCERFGLQPRSIHRALGRAGRADLWPRIAPRERAA